MARTNGQGQAHHAAQTLERKSPCFLSSAPLWLPRCGLHESLRLMSA